MYKLNATTANVGVKLKLQPYKGMF